MNAYNECKEIVELDLDPIKVKLMHEESGEGWSLAQANAVEFEYRRFLYLMKTFPNEQTAPLADVDTFWHYHILDTLKYATDCSRVFGYFLHHFPYIGLRGAADEDAHYQVGQRMAELYEETFGEPYLRQNRGAAASGTDANAESAFGGATPGTAFSGATGIRTAFSGATGIRTAFSGASPGTAFSGATGVRTAFSGATGIRTAFSGAQAAAGLSGSEVGVAFSGARVAAAGKQSSTSLSLDTFYTERPALTLT